MENELLDQNGANERLVPSVTTAKRKPGRPKKADCERVATWNYDSVNYLLNLRHNILQHEFSSAKNNSMINACWISLHHKLA